MSETDNYSAPAELGRVRTIALGVGGIATVVWAVGAYFNTEQALLSWLLGFIFWGGIGIGSLGMLMLQYLTGGAWGVVIRRILEAGSRTLPMLAILFVPLAIGVYTRSVYQWTHLPASDHVMMQRGIFMTTGMWILRSVIYFLLFGAMAYFLDSRSKLQEKTTGVEESRLVLEQASRFSGPALVIFSIIVTFAAVDWTLTLDPHWFSTIWGLLFVAGWGLSCLCFVVAVLAFLADKAPMNLVLGKRHLHDIGKLILALVMVWAYFNFSQFLIVWSGNIPEETSWFLPRMAGGWGYVGVILILFHFAFPFLVLLQQDFKRHAKWLAMIAVFVLFMRLLDMFYIIGPSHRISGETGVFQISFTDIAAPIAVGGLWIWWFVGELMKRPLFPKQDPYFLEAIEHGRGH